MENNVSAISFETSLRRLIHPERASTESLSEEYSELLRSRSGAHGNRSVQENDDIEHRKAFLAQELGHLAFRRKQLNRHFNEISCDYGRAPHPDDDTPLNRDLDILTENVRQLVSCSKA